MLWATHPNLVLELYLDSWYFCSNTGMKTRAPAQAPEPGARPALPPTVPFNRLVVEYLVKQARRCALRWHYGDLYGTVTLKRDD